MKETITLCDVCKEKVARAKCCLCKNDVCGTCGKMFFIEKASSLTEYLFDVKLTRIREEEKKNLNIVCSICSEKFGKMLEDLEKVKPKEKKNLTLKILKFMKENTQSIVTANKL